MPPPALLVALLVLAGPASSEPAATPPTERPPTDSRLRLHTDQVDPQAVHESLELRVGSRWQRFTIDVSDEPAGSVVSVRMQDDAGTVHTRELTLTAETTAGRSRELASVLALLVDQLASEAARDPGPEPPPPPQTAPPTGWLGLGPRLALAPRAPVDLDAGATLAGGTWLWGEHLQPLGELSWARSTAGALTVDALRLGGGLLGGTASFRERIWWGAGAIVRAQWARARARGTADGWWLSPAVFTAIQARLGPVVLGAWVGVDLLVPPLRARGGADQVRWGTVRPMIALHVGLRLPPQRRSSRAH